MRLVLYCTLSDVRAACAGKRTRQRAVRDRPHGQPHLSLYWFVSCMAVAPDLADEAPQERCVPPPPPPFSSVKASPSGLRTATSTEMHPNSGFVDQQLSIQNAFAPCCVSEDRSALQLKHSACARGLQPAAADPARGCYEDGGGVIGGRLRRRPPHALGLIAG